MILKLVLHCRFIFAKRFTFKKGVLKNLFRKYVQSNFIICFLHQLFCSDKAVQHDFQRLSIKLVLRSKMKLKLQSRPFLNSEKTERTAQALTK